MVTSTETFILIILIFKVFCLYKFKICIRNYNEKYTVQKNHNIYLFLKKIDKKAHHSNYLLHRFDAAADEDVTKFELLLLLLLLLLRNAAELLVIFVCDCEAATF